MEGQWQRTIDPISGYIEGYPLNADFTDTGVSDEQIDNEWHRHHSDGDILGYITAMVMSQWWRKRSGHIIVKENHQPFRFYDHQRN